MSGTRYRRTFAAFAAAMTIPVGACATDPVPGPDPGGDLGIATRVVHAPGSSESVWVQFEATGGDGPLSWTLDPSTPLPPWASFSPDGLLSGTRGEADPPLGEVLVVHASDGVDTASALVPVLFIDLIDDPVVESVGTPLPEGGLLTTGVVRNGSVGVAALRGDGSASLLELDELIDVLFGLRADSGDVVVTLRPSLAIRDRQTGEMKAAMAVPPGASPTAARLSPDGSLLAVAVDHADSAASILIFDAATGALVRSDAITGSGFGPVTMSWRDDSSMLVATGTPSQGTSTPVLLAPADPIEPPVVHTIPAPRCAAVGWATVPSVVLNCSTGLLSLDVDGSIDAILPTIPEGMPKPPDSHCPTEQRRTFAPLATLNDPQAVLSPGRRWLAVAETCTTTFSGLTIPLSHRIGYVDLLTPGDPAIVPLSEPRAIAGADPTRVVATFPFTWR